MSEVGFAMSKLVDRSRENRFGVNAWEVHEREEVEFLGKDWILLPGVYPMQHVRSSRFFWARLAELGPVENFLEMGCGSGALSILALTTGMCRRVTAADINATAVENTVRNAERHGVEDELRAVESDLFSALGRDERFDLIFWNSPGVFIESDAVLSEHERSIFDPGYEAHARYFAGGPNHLAESGRLTLGFCGKGDLRLLEQTAADAGLSMEILADDPEGSHPHWLLEFRPPAL
jgi:methylase of polypeptide subunit release factors